MMWDALSQLWWMEHTHHSRELPTGSASAFDVEGFEHRLSDTERRMQAEERRLQVLALEGEIPPRTST
jgi:hypothetical protein